MNYAIAFLVGASFAVFEWQPIIAVVILLASLFVSSTD